MPADRTDSVKQLTGGSAQGDWLPRRAYAVRGKQTYMQQSISTVTSRPMDEDASDRGYSRAMEKLVGYVQHISLARDLPGLMAVVRDAARDLTGADGATFILREREQCFYADENAIAPLWKGRRFPLDACISGWSMLHREAVAIEDIYADPRIPHDAYRPTFVRSLAMVPIRTIEPLGAIGNYWAERRQPRAAEIKILQALADTTAVAMENVQVYSELERRVKERTEELELANRDLDGFCNSVSHDLRAPVRAISGFCDLIAADHGARLEAEPELTRKLGVIKDNAGRMQTLIDDLLAFSRFGRQSLRIETVDMTALARNAVERLLAEMPGSAVEVRLADLPLAEGDASLLEQVWANLLSNALKFSSREPRPSVEIGGADAGNECTYYVADNGAGFDPRYAARLFQAFHRLHHETEFPGTGVGLALVHRIVVRHGGRVWADGTLGEGATFHFTLPKEGAQAGV